MELTGKKYLPIFDLGMGLAMDQWSDPQGLKVSFFFHVVYWTRIIVF